MPIYADTVIGDAPLSYWRMGEAGTAANVMIDEIAAVSPTIGSAVDTRSPGVLLDGDGVRTPPAQPRGWWRADDVDLAEGVTAAGVAALTDFSGTGRPCSTGGSTLGAALHRNRVNGHHILSKAGASPWYKITNLANLVRLVPGFSLVAAVRKNSAGTMTLMSVNGGTGVIRVQVGHDAVNGWTISGRHLDGDALTTVSVGSPDPDVGWMILSFRVDFAGATAQIWKNGASVINQVAFGTANSTSDTAAASAFLGADSSGAAGYWDGDIGEALFTHTQISAVNRDGYEDLLGMRYGVMGAGAMRFPGSGNANDHLTGTNAYGFTGNSPFSIEAWINPGVFDTTPRTIVGKWQTGNDGWLFTYGGASPNDDLRFFRIAGGVSEFASVVPPSPGFWSHVVATYDGSQLTLYVNGVKGTPYATANPVTSNGSIAANALNFTIGNRADNVWAFLGGIDEVAFYDHALTARQVSDHYLAGMGTLAVPEDSYEAGSLAGSRGAVLL